MAIYISHGYNTVGYFLLGHFAWSKEKEGEEKSRERCMRGVLISVSREIHLSNKLLASEQATTVTLLTS